MSRTVRMTWDDVQRYALAKPGAWRDEPWEDSHVVKVGEKVFAFLGSHEPGPAGTIGVKCGPDRDVADEWLRRYPTGATAMAYLGRYGWNSLRIGGAIPDDELTEAIDASYDTVVAKLPVRARPTTAEGPGTPNA